MMATKSGAEFDKAFALQMVEDHQKALDLVDSSSVSTQDEGVRTLLNGLKPVLQAHKKIAQALAGATVRA